MNLTIRDMRPEDADEKGYVHYKTWQETYSGLIDEQYLASQTPDKCRAMAHRWPENTLLAEVDGSIVGFSCYGMDDSGAGEVIAIYLLREAQGRGLGRRLMDATIERLKTVLPSFYGFSKAMTRPSVFMSIMVSVSMAFQKSFPSALSCG